VNGLIVCVINRFTTIRTLTRVLGLFMTAETMQLDSCCVVIKDCLSTGAREILPLLNQSCLVSACGCVVVHF
jgi:hypothetical protein